MNDKSQILCRDERRETRGEAETEVVIVGPGEAEYRLSRGLDMIGEGRAGEEEEVTTSGLRPRQTASCRRVQRCLAATSTTRADLDSFTTTLNLIF